MAGTESVESTKVLGGVISSRVGGTKARVTKDRMSSKNGEIDGSPYASQRPIQMS